MLSVRQSTGDSDTLIIYTAFVKYETATLSEIIVEDVDLVVVVLTLINKLFSL